MARKTDRGVPSAMIWSSLASRVTYRMEGATCATHRAARRGKDQAVKGYRPIVACFDAERPYVLAMLRCGWCI